MSDKETEKSFKINSKQKYNYPKKTKKSNKKNNKKNNKNNQIKKTNKYKKRKCDDYIHE